MSARTGRFARFEKAYLDMFSASAKLVFAARKGGPDALAAAVIAWRTSYIELGAAYTDSFIAPS